MADKKISALDVLTGAAAASTDYIPVVDTSTGMTKRMAVGEVKTAIGLEGVDVPYFESLKSDAEAARDAAFVNANVYADTTAGLAAVALGEQFTVVSGDDLVRYREDAGPVATEVARTLTASASLSKARHASSLSPFYANDLLTDKLAPLFVNSYEFIHSSTTPSNFTEATIATRDSDTQFTVAAGHGDRFVAKSAFIVKDDATGLYHDFTCFSVAGDVITLWPGQVLPTTISVAQTMHDGTNGQHLSRFGYLAYADHIADIVERYCYKKNEPLAAYNPGLCNTTSYNTYDINNYDNTEVVFPVTRLGTASGGGWVSGTTSLPKTCSQIGSDQNTSDTFPACYLPRYYTIVDTVAGNGISLSFDTYGYAGFCEIPLFAHRRLYDTTLYTTGRARLIVKADGITIHDQVYEQGLLHIARVDFPSAQAIEVQFLLADSVTSDIRLHGVFIYPKSDDTESAPWTDDVVIAMLGDSWFEKPDAITGETLPLRADGSTAAGMQFITTKLRERFLADGVRATVHNMGRGGMTSEWGRYWVKEIVKLDPKPTHCLLHFAINDHNSVDEAAGATPSVYDFSPTDMWAALLSSSGGVFGSVSYERWFSNMQWICDYLAKNGIKPVVLMPPITASASQTQTMQQKMTTRIAAGFNPIYAESGRP